jgi:gliding motility-associated-like protein
MYQLFILDANGCLLRKGPYVLGGEAGPVSATFIVTQARCGKTVGSVAINAVQGGIAPYTYAVDGGAFSPSNTIPGLAPGTHTLRVKDAFNCVYTEDFAVTFTALPNIQLSVQDTTVCYDETLQMRVVGDVEEIELLTWSIRANNRMAVLKATQDQMVTITVKDKNNCIIRDTAIVNVKACSTPDKCLVVPTAFTPNRDGKNEAIGPVRNGCAVSSLLFQVFNRWGELVFSSRNTADKWSGNYKGVIQPPGTYVYVCNYTGDDGVSRQLKGTFLLMR